MSSHVVDPDFLALPLKSTAEITQPREWADYVDRVAMPPVIFSDFNMSTVSQAN